METMKEALEMKKEEPTPATTTTTPTPEEAIRAILTGKMKMDEKVAALALLIPAPKTRKARATRQPGEKFWTPEFTEGEPISHTFYRLYFTGKTNTEIIAEVKALHPKWDAEAYGTYYVGWHRCHLRKMGFEVPGAVRPVKEEKTTSPTTEKPLKRVKDMTPEERAEYVAARNAQLKAEGKAPIMGTTDPTMPTPTTTGKKKVSRKK